MITQDMNIMAHDDATQGANQGGSGGGGGLGIGSSEAVINLNENEAINKGIETAKNSFFKDNEVDADNYIPPKNQKEEPTETPIEESKTQGQYEQNIDYYQRQVEKWNDFLDKGDMTNWHSFIGKLTKEELTQLEKYGNENNINIGKVKANSPEAKALMTDFINHMVSNYKNDIYEIKTETEYDNRTDAERRQDTATQRAAADYVAAGLNPRALSGFVGGGGGGGGGSSKSDEEEEKRKKRRREIEEIRRAKQAEKMRQNELITGIVQNLTNTATKAVGAGAFMRNQRMLQADRHVHNRYMIEAEKLAGNKKYRLDDQVGYYDENGKWHNINLRDIRE